MKSKVIKHAIGIWANGGLGRESSEAAICQMAYFNDDHWPEKVIYQGVDAARETGRRASGYAHRLPQASPGKSSLLLLSDVNPQAIGEAANEPEIWSQYQKLYEVISPEILAVGISNTAAIGGYQRPAFGTALFLLKFEEIESAMNHFLAALRNVAGNDRAEIVVVGGANGAIGSSFSIPIARLFRERVRGFAKWQVSLILAAAQPAGQTPDSVVGNAVLGSLLKDLAASSHRG